MRWIYLPGYWEMWVLRLVICWKNLFKTVIIPSRHRSELGRASRRLQWDVKSRYLPPRFDTGQHPSYLRRKVDSLLVQSMRFWRQWDTRGFLRNTERKNEKLPSWGDQVRVRRLQRVYIDTKEWCVYVCSNNVGDASRKTRMELIQHCLG